MDGGMGGWMDGWMDVGRCMYLHNYMQVCRPIR